VNAVFSYYDKTEQLVVSTHVVVYAHKQGMMSYSKSLNLPLLSSHHKHHIKWSQGLHSMGTSYLHQPTPKTVVRCLALLFHHILQEGRKKLINNHRIRDGAAGQFSVHCVSTKSGEYWYSDILFTWKLLIDLLYISHQIVVQTTL